MKITFGCKSKALSGNAMTAEWEILNRLIAGLSQTSFNWL